MGKALTIYKSARAAPAFDPDGLKSRDGYDSYDSYDNLVESARLPLDEKFAP